MTKKKVRRDAVTDVLPGIVFIGCGMTQKKADKIAAKLRRKLSGEVFACPVKLATFEDACRMEAAKNDSTDS